MKEIDVATARLEASRLKEANEWMERYRVFWEASFDRLEGFLEELKTKEKEKEKRRAREK
jgi:hypothetical protein